MNILSYVSYFCPKWLAKIMFLLSASWLIGCCICNSKLSSHFKVLFGLESFSCPWFLAKCFSIFLELNILNVLGHFVYALCQIQMVFYFFRHGEKSAGVIAAVLNNSNCGVGLAYKAHIGGMSQATVNNTSIYAKTWTISLTISSKMKTSTNIAQRSMASTRGAYFWMLPILMWPNSCLKIWCMLFWRDHCQGHYILLFVTF